MRDPERIKPFCDALAETWRRVPDWRFGQLVMNMLGDIEAKSKQSVFYMEDDEMLAAIRAYLEKKE